MTTLADRLPDSKDGFLNWTHICPIEKITKVPASKKELCEEAIGIAHELTVFKGYAKQPWKLPGGARRAMAITFKFKDGESPPLVLNTTNSMSAMSALGKDPEKWAGQKVCVYIAKDRNPDGGKPCCCVRLKAIT